MEPMYQTETRCHYAQCRLVLWQLWQLYGGGRSLLYVGGDGFSRVLVRGRRRWDGIYVTPPCKYGRVDRTGKPAPRPSRRPGAVQIAFAKIMRAGRRRTTGRNHAASTAGTGPSRVGYFVRVRASVQLSGGANLQGGQLLPWVGQTHRHAHGITCRAPLLPRHSGVARSTSSRALHTGEVRGSPIEPWAPAA